VKELHAALLRNQDTYTVVDQFGQAFEKTLEKGRYKDIPNSPTQPDGAMHEYCPPEHVASEMDRLISMYTEHQACGVPPEVEAAWLHHRFTQIHPFEDGNGRVARAIASLVFIRAGWFPLIVKRDDRTRYIDALENADQDDLRPLVSLFVEAQRNALIQATEVAYDVKPIASADEAIAAARDRLMQRGKLPPREWLAAKDTADNLLTFAGDRLERLAQQLNQEIGSVGRDFAFGVTRGKEGFSKSADLAGHVPDFAAYETVVRLKLYAGRHDALRLSFYGLGPHYRGIIGVAACLSLQDVESTLVKGGTFQINYEEDFASAQARFSPWLERVIVEGLTEWRRTL
jgi:fido (protein-threonine AMPylation protein)